jgi:DNA-binding NarL/FixJ family response regulator
MKLHSCLIVDSSRIMRTELANVLKEIDGAVDIFEAGTATDAMVSYVANEPRLVIVQLGGGMRDMIDLVRQISQENADSRILAIASSIGGEQGTEVLAAGAKHCLTGPVVRTTLQEALEQVVEPE